MSVRPPPRTPTSRTDRQKRAYRKRATNMWGRPLPLKKLQQNFWLLVLFAIFLMGVWTVYVQLEMHSNGNPNNHRYSSWRELGKALAHNNIPAVGPNLQFYRPERPQELQEITLWNLSVAWKPEFVGQVNLHIFEDWCGSSIQQLRRNLHFPLFPHIRTTVSKLAVTPQWTNYGLRMFGYLHPAADGEFQFAVSSDDNSEFWLSDDQSVGRLRLLCRVGPAGKQWTAPGEYGKFQEQVSTPVRLSASKRYYFELLHKQDDAGTDHVELAWRQPLVDEDFTLVDSQFLSLFSDDRNLPLGNTSLIPLSKASHHKEEHKQHPADMLKDDPRDSAYKIHLLPMNRVQNILPSCIYKPSYLVEGYPLQRYQGLQFVRLTYVYPNDYTRLSHMEKDNECMYQERLQYRERLRYKKYMKVDRPQPGPADHPGWPEDYKPSDFQYENEDQFVVIEEEEEPSEDEMIRQRKLFLVADEDILPKPGRRNRRKRGRPRKNVRNMDVESLKNLDPNRSNNLISQTPTTERENRETTVDFIPPKIKRTHLQKSNNVTHDQGHTEVERNGSSVSSNKERRNQGLERENRMMQRDGRQKNVPQGTTLCEMDDHQKMKKEIYRRQGLYFNELQQDLDKIEIEEPPPGAKLHHKPRIAEGTSKDPNLHDERKLQDKMQRPNRNKLKIHEDETPDKEEMPNSQINHRKDKNLGQDDRGVQHNVVGGNSTQKGNAKVEQTAAFNQFIHLGSQLRYRPGEHVENPLKQRYTTSRRSQLGKDPQDVGWTKPNLERLEGKNQSHEEGINPGQKMDFEENVAKSQDYEPVELSRRRTEQGMDITAITDSYQDREQRPESADRTAAGNTEINGTGVRKKVEPSQGIAPSNEMKGERGENQIPRIPQHPNIETNGEEYSDHNVGDNQEQEGHRPNREDDSENEEDNELEDPPVFEKPVLWNRTFHASQTDFQILRLDSLDLQCNTSGNLQLKESEALTIVGSFMKKLDQWHQGMYKLQKIVNIEKHLDYVRGSRYFLDMVLKDRFNRHVRFAHYVFAPGWTGMTKEVKEQERDMRNKMGRKLLGKEQHIELCWPTGLVWNPLAPVYFIVPVKNQARWVQKFIWDMEFLHQATRDPNFSVIIVDFSSSDMDVRDALKRSRLPRYQFVQLEGNFERSAGLQAGIDLVKNPRSILFLCDLHMHFPSSIIDSVRTHTVEGRMVYAPTVMRLNCGASPWWPDGYWEVNGFGLLGIYKSDLEHIGGMNTIEFRDTWGGEDWELLDRIIYAGLEVERLAVRNFYHHFHSKRGMWNRQTAANVQQDV